MKKVNLTFTLKSGKDLPALDIGGSSDPYVDILFFSPKDEDRKFKSKVFF